MNYYQTSYFLNHLNQNEMNNNVNKIFTPLLDSIFESQKVTDPYTKAGIYAHTTCVLSGNYPYMHKTPDNENTFVAGYLKGLQDGMDAAKKIYTEAHETPTVFLNQPEN